MSSVSVIDTHFQVYLREIRSIQCHSMLKIDGDMFRIINAGCVSVFSQSGRRSVVIGRHTHGN